MRLKGQRRTDQDSIDGQTRRRRQGPIGATGCSAPTKAIEGSRCGRLLERVWAISQPIDRQHCQLFSRPMACCSLSMSHGDNPVSAADSLSADETASQIASAWASAGWPRTSMGLWMNRVCPSSRTKTAMALMPECSSMTLIKSGFRPERGTSDSFLSRSDAILSPCATDRLAT